LPAFSERDDEAGDSGITDDLLRLIFTCCHPRWRWRPGSR